MHLKYADFMLTKGLKLSIGKPFKIIDPKLWHEWIKPNGVQDLRNEIVHRNRTIVLEEESENAIKVIDNMIKKLQEK